MRHSLCRCVMTQRRKSRRDAESGRSSRYVSTDLTAGSALGGSTPLRSSFQAVQSRLLPSRPAFCMCTVHRVPCRVCLWARCKRRPAYSTEYVHTWPWQAAQPYPRVTFTAVWVKRYAWRKRIIGRRRQKPGTEVGTWRCRCFPLFLSKV